MLWVTTHVWASSTAAVVPSTRQPPSRAWKNATSKPERAPRCCQHAVAGGGRKDIRPSVTDARADGCGHDVAMTWTAPEITRVNGPLATLAGDERTLAEAWLDFHRQTLLWKCGGLTAEQLKRRNIEPSNLSLLGLVRHMAEEERDWFRTRFAGEQVCYLYRSDDELNAEFDVDTADAESDLATYARELCSINRR